jgi:CubicO group peptidase (beta-lactamase class C family)
MDISRALAGVKKAPRGSRLRDRAGWALPLLVIASGSSAATDIEQRIQRIQNGLLPPVLVKSELVSSSKLSDRMAALHVPGVSIAVIHAGKLAWARGFGVVRIGGPPVTPETLFQAASISKPVTTLAVLHLSHEGKLSLDTDVNQYLTSWKLPPSEFTKQSNVTLRKLLTHSAGVTVHGFAGYPANARLPSLVQVLNGETPANNPPIRVDMVPGTQWRYSGGGFEIIQEVLNDVTGTPFPKLMHDLVLQPLGMQYSTYEQPLPDKLLAHAATPYRGDGTPVDTGPHVYPEQAAAGLWTTPSDLARLAIGVQQALSGTSAIVLPLGTAHAMLAPMYNQQAIGFVVGGSTAQKYFTHGGANEGYRCLLVSYQNGDGAVIMTNGDNGSEVASEIIRTIAHEYQWPDFAPPERTLNAVDPSSFDRYVGAYRLESGETVTFWRDDTHIKSRVSGQRAVEIFPTSEHEYFEKVVDARWEFLSDASQAGHSVTLYQNGQKLLANRLTGVEGQTELETSTAIEKRFEEQTAVPGSDAALRRLIEGLASGEPRYDEMSPGLAKITHEQLPSLQKSIVGFGPLQSISFKGVGPGGADIYQVTFERAVREFRLFLGPDGRVRFAQFSP